MNIAPIEGLWLAINLFSLGVTFSNLVDAVDSWRAVRGMSVAWQIQARANVRSESIRLIQVAALLIVILPSLSRAGDVPLSWNLVVIMAVPAGLALNGYLDRRVRRRLERLIGVQA